MKGDGAELVDEGLAPAGLSGPRDGEHVVAEKAAELHSFEIWEVPAGLNFADDSVGRLE
jgi:hypothetical protein